MQNLMLLCTLCYCLKCDCSAYPTVDWTYRNGDTNYKMVILLYKNANFILSHLGECKLLGGKDWVSYLALMSRLCQAPKFLLTGHQCFLSFFPCLQQSYLRALFVSLTGQSFCCVTQWGAQRVHGPGGSSATQGLFLLLFTWLIGLPICQLRFMTTFQGTEAAESFPSRKVR